MIEETETENENENRERTEPWPRVNKLLKEKGTTHLCIDLIALDRNAPTEWSMIHGCDDGGVMTVAQRRWHYCLRPSGYMAREKIISYYCATVHTLLKSYRLRTTWVRNVRAREGLHQGQWLIIMRRALMAMPGHYCSLTSSDKVNEESMLEEWWEKRRMVEPYHSRDEAFIDLSTGMSHAWFQQWPCRVPTCVILNCHLVVLKHLVW